MGRPRKKLLPSTDMSSFGIWLVTEMNESQLHLLDIVEQVGISYSVVYSWIRGDSNPRLVNLIEVCDVMSQQTNKPPFDLLSTAILCFPEAVYAQKRWAKRTRGKVREQNLVNGSSLYARMPSTDERQYFVPLDKTLEADRRAGDLTPGS